MAVTSPEGGGAATAVAAGEDAYACPAGEVLAAVGSSAGGLGQDEARQRAERFGLNVVAPPKRDGFAGELLESLREPLQLLLIVVGVLSFIWGEVQDGVAILVVILAVATVEALSERRASRALDALRGLSAPQARVRRDGAVADVPAERVVPGDVLVLDPGAVVAADARVLSAAGLAADESALTGEPVAAAKGPSPVAPGTPLAARSSMVYAGTAIAGGSGAAVVVVTGRASELGRLGVMVAEQKEPQTPLQRSMRELAKAALVVAITASVLVPLIGVLRGQPVRAMILAGLTLAFATIPEELPILVTVLTAIGGRRLVRRGALVRRLRAGEAVGAVTVVVTDKTGTLTENTLRLGGSPATGRPRCGPRRRPGRRMIPRSATRSRSCWPPRPPAANPARPSPTSRSTPTASG